MGGQLACLRPACAAILASRVEGQLACLMVENCREVSVEQPVGILLMKRLLRRG